MLEMCTMSNLDFTQLWKQEGDFNEIYASGSEYRLLYEIKHFGYKIFSAMLYDSKWESALGTVHDLTETKTTWELLVGRFMLIKNFKTS